MMPEGIRNAVHHWWPETISRFWADDRGLVHRLTADGKVLSSQPRSFGAIRNHNTIKLAKDPTPWDETFEPTFDKADTAFAGLIRWLQSLASLIAPGDARFETRLHPFVLAQSRQAELTECLASLVVRSPSFRNRIEGTVAYYLQRSGDPPPAVDKKLIGLNARRGQLMLSQAMAGRGKFAVLIGSGREFIFGDGFLHNISSAASAPMAPRILVPLTPEIAVFYTRPTQYLSLPNAFVMNLRPDETEFVNDTVRIYAKDYLFFRNDQPAVDAEFGAAKHREFAYHRHQWIDTLEEAMAFGDFGPQSKFRPPA